MITAEQAKTALDYNPETGLFTWKIRAAKHINIGAIAGGHDSHGYLRISIQGTRRQAHRIAWLLMTGCWPADQIDHINGIRDDNRWRNLRCVTHHENQRNMAKYSSNTSGVTGVCWHKQRGKWKSEIKGDMRKIYLGLYITLFDAAAARKSAELLYGYHENHGRV